MKLLGVIWIKWFRMSCIKNIVYVDEVTMLIFSLALNVVSSTESADVSNTLSWLSWSSIVHVRTFRTEDDI